MSIYIIHYYYSKGVFHHKSAYVVKTCGKQTGVKSRKAL